MARPRTRQERWTNQIVMLAETVAMAVPSEDQPESAVRLTHVLTRVLDAGSDHPIHRAVEALDARHAHEAGDLVLMAAGEAAGTLDVVLSRPGGNLAGVASTFLVPLVLAASPPTVVPRVIPQGAAWEGLVRSLRTHGLIDDQSSVVCHNALYTLADLPRSWVAERQWLRLLVDGLSRKEPALPPPALEAAPSIETPVDGTPHLRFLVGTVLGTGDEPPLWEADDPETLEAQGRFDDWLASSAAFVQAALGLEHVVVGHPDRWDDARSAGETLWNMAGAALAIERHCAQAGCTPDAVLADVRWQGGEDGAWLVSLTSLGHVSRPWSWHPTYDPDEDRDALLDTLRSQGIRRMAVDERGTP